MKILIDVIVWQLVEVDSLALFVIVEQRNFLLQLLHNMNIHSVIAKVFFSIR
jgi:hypothetical protein